MQTFHRQGLRTLLKCCFGERQLPITGRQTQRNQQDHDKAAQEENQIGPVTGPGVMPRKRHRLIEWRQAQGAREIFNRQVIRRR